MENFFRRRVLAPAVTTLVAAFSGSVSTAPAQAATPDRYVALGDSYSSGSGAGSSDLDADCARSTYSYPYLVASQRPGTELTLAACGGAVTSDVTDSQVNALTPETKYVTITIGGNDIGFGDLVRSCTLSDCTSTVDTSNARITGELPAKLDTTFAAIRSKAPSATVVVLGYPRPFADRTCSAAPGVTVAKQAALNNLVDNLDAVLADRAQAAGFVYGNPNPAWAGHDVCASTPFTNGLVISALGESYHPTRAGYASGYTPLVRSLIG
ncbi:hypothetical protein ACG83_19815 [Frankia sp. R43]|uniref:SGNH/GDSL hydrolase family protein n=1 Tax=Frankia sp. R43 TaxID=269536 RepID=UPI0006D944DB|nr:SGNH/GDSL hydrolase family protein [Frankia sp. R43]KPM54240.1 hypothetical protein ACG83_19815 [Frankia sp. R43]